MKKIRTDSESTREIPRTASNARRTVRRLLQVGDAITAVCLLASCSRPGSPRLQGYIEGEFVYVASPLAGALEKLQVQRGAQVNSGDCLFTLDSVAEKAARDEAERRLIQARANLEDAKKGRRPS